MTATKFTNPNSYQLPGSIAGAPIVAVTNPVNQQIWLQHVIPPASGPQLPNPAVNPVIAISLPNAAGSGFVLSQQNCVDLLPSIQAFIANGVLS